MGNTQVAIGVGNGYGDDLVLTPTGDILVLQDAPGNPAASIQLLTRIILTNPLLRDQTGRPISRPDDIVNTNFGSGVRALLGQPLTSALASGIQTRILAAIAASPYFATSPAPTCDVFTDGTGDSTLYVTVTASALSGDVVTLANLALS